MSLTIPTWLFGAIAAERNGRGAHDRSEVNRAACVSGAGGRSAAPTTAPAEQLDAALG